MISTFSPKAWMGLVLLSLSLMIFSACSKDKLEDFPTSTENIITKQDSPSEFDPAELFGEEDLLQSRASLPKGLCKFSFSAQQDYTCCGDNTCSCTNISINGLLSNRRECCGNLANIWFTSPYLCSQDTWDGSSNITINLNSAAACIELGDGSCQYIDIPVTMHYIYYCNDKGYHGTYNSTVTMLLC